MCKISSLEELIGYFNTTKAIHGLNCLTYKLIATNKYDEIISSSIKNDSEFNQYIKTAIANSKDPYFKEIYFTRLMFTTICSLADALNKYARKDGKDSKNSITFFENDTMTFARYIRNCITHKLIFDFISKEDKARVKSDNPPQWINSKGEIIKITWGLRGKKFSREFMNDNDLARLMNDLISESINQLD